MIQYAGTLSRTLFPREDRQCDAEKPSGYRRHGRHESAAARNGRLQPQRKGLLSGTRKRKRGADHPRRLICANRRLKRFLINLVLIRQIMKKWLELLQKKQQIELLK